MSAFTFYQENKVLNELINNLIPASMSMWLGLFSTAPTDASGGSELTGGNYIRVASGLWTTSTGSQGFVANAASITFATATIAWAAASTFAIFDASTSSAGNMIAWASLTAARTLATSDVAVFGIGSLTITLE